jgi:hypothetical protein
LAGTRVEHDVQVTDNTPSCPNCGKHFGIKECSTFWNPWQYACPQCGVALEASGVQKAVALAVVPAGILLAALLSWLEERGGWEPRALLFVLAIMAAVLIAGAIASWRITRFTIKRS